MSTAFENKLKKDLEGRGWLVTRAAGSLGAADLVALRPDQDPHLLSRDLFARYTGKTDARLLEVKATSGEVFYLSDAGGYGQKQWDALRDLTRRGFSAAFVVRFKRRGWEVFPVRGDGKPLRLGEGISLDHYFE